MSSSSSRGIGRGKVQGEGGRGGKCKSEEKKRVKKREYPRQVSILWPSAYKAIIIPKSYRKV